MKKHDNSSDKGITENDTKDIKKKKMDSKFLGQSKADKKQIIRDTGDRGF